MFRSNLNPQKCSGGANELVRRPWLESTSSIASSPPQTYHRSRALAVVTPDQSFYGINLNGPKARLSASADRVFGPQFEWNHLSFYDPNMPLLKTS